MKTVYFRNNLTSIRYYTPSNREVEEKRMTWYNIKQNRINNYLEWKNGDANEDEEKEDDDTKYWSYDAYIAVIGIIAFTMSIATVKKKS